MPLVAASSAADRNAQAMLEALNLDRTLAKSEYKAQLPTLQDRLFALQRAARDAGMGTIVVFEGWEACGKGAAIRRLTQRLEPRALRLQATRAPRTHELALPWLQRFWVATRGARSESSMAAGIAAFSWTRWTA
jgi:polyphosphate kinase 2 (PPK2 family)